MNRLVLEAPDEALKIASRTDIGRVRQANEDSCEVFEHDDGSVLLVVADGMGGHRGGATASRTAIETIAAHFEANATRRPGRKLDEAIRAANARIFERAQQDPELRGMGTTVVALHLDAQRRGVVAHVGDSRAYRYRQGRLEALTTDHSVVAEMQKRGLLSAEEAAIHPRRNEILRSVGVLDEVEIEMNDVVIQPGDRFLLCSDGLSGVLRDDEIATVVQSEEPSEAVESLIRLANERGGPDNISVQILSIPADAAQGDPEATAPVELTAIGIEAIESRRRQRRRQRGLLGALIALLLLGIGWWAWRAFAADSVFDQLDSSGRRNATSDVR